MNKFGIFDKIKMANYFTHLICSELNDVFICNHFEDDYVYFTKNLDRISLFLGNSKDIDVSIKHFKEYMKNRWGLDKVIYEKIEHFDTYVITKGIKFEMNKAKFNTILGIFLLKGFKLNG